MLRENHFIYNKQHHYDPQTGGFTCVRPGVYEFSLRLHYQLWDCGSVAQPQDGAAEFQVILGKSSLVRGHRGPA